MVYLIADVLLILLGLYLCLGGVDVMLPGFLVYTAVVIAATLILRELKAIRKAVEPQNEDEDEDLD